MIETVKWRVNRDSHEDRLRDFLDWMEAVKKDTIHTVRSHIMKIIIVINIIPTYW